MQPTRQRDTFTSNASTGAPLCVDLDDALVCSDTLLESILLLVRRAPGQFFRLIFLLLRDRAAGKQAIASVAAPDPATLPYRAALVDHIRKERAAGRRILLVTGADRRIAEGVSKHLGCFDLVLASDGRTNLTGARKLAAIQSILGGSAFSYAGDSKADLPLWQASETVIFAGAPQALQRRLKNTRPVEGVFGPDRPGWRAWLRLLRVNQWVKNVLIAVPMFLAHELTNLEMWQSAIVAILSFSACASALYIWNDLSDLQADRAHHTKRRRPVAAGIVGLPSAFGVMAVLLLCSAALAITLPAAFQLLLLLYAAGSIAYTLALKRILFLDVVTLTGLYILRVYSGGAATGIEISMWTTVFMIFLFLSLALLKRLIELRKAGEEVEEPLPGRGYIAADLPMLMSLASAAAYVSALVVGLYIYSPDVQMHYSHATYLWLVIPVLVYWLSRTLLLANRGELDDDPVVYAVHDPASYGALLACMVIVFLAE